MRQWIAAALFVLGGCTTPAPTVITDLEDDKVIIQAVATTAFEQILDKATEGCAIHGRKPVPISESCAGESSCHTRCYQWMGCSTTCSKDCWVKHHLFACTD